MCIYIYTHIGKFNASASLCLEKKSWRGDWGEGAAPPPQSRMTRPIFTSNATCKNAAPPPQAEWQYLFSQAMLHAKTQRLPPKQNDNIYFHKQGYKQKHLYMSLYKYIDK